MCTLVGESRHYQTASIALDGMTDWLTRMQTYLATKDAGGAVRQGAKLGAHIAQLCAVSTLLVKLNDHWEELWLMGVAESYFVFSESTAPTPSCSSSTMP